MDTTMAPPLDIDLNTVKTDMPLLADGIYEMQLVKVELKKTSAQQDMLHFELATTVPATALTGEPLGPGTRVFDNCMLDRSGEATWEMIARNAGAIAQSIGINVEGQTFPDQLNWLRTTAPAVWQGQIARVKVGNEPAGVAKKTGKAYKAKNTVQWIPKGK